MININISVLFYTKQYDKVSSKKDDLKHHYSNSSVILSNAFLTSKKLVDNNLRLAAKYMIPQTRSIN